MKTYCCVLTLLIALNLSAEEKSKATVLFSFDGTNGSAPYAGMIKGKDGLFYGTTSCGGVNLDKAPDCGNGTIYKMLPDGTVKTLFVFGGTNGAFLPAGLIQANDGNFYGTTFRGGKYDRGTIFKITPNGEFASLFSCDDLSGINPNAGLFQGFDGKLYGTCLRSGRYGGGTVFRISTNGGFELIYSFGSKKEGGQPLTLVPTSKGIYGITVGGDGTIFKLSPTGDLKTVFVFGGTNGSTPNYFIKGTDGNLYGATVFGGKENAGVLFQLTPKEEFKILWGGKKEQAESPSSISQDSSGNFYFYLNHGSSLVKMTPDLKISVICEGRTPLIGNILRDDKGNYFCTSAIDGSYKHGAIIKLR